MRHESQEKNSIITDTNNLMVKSIVVTSDADITTPMSSASAPSFLRRWWWLILPSLVLTTFVIKEMTAIWFNTGSQLIYQAFIAPIAGFLIWSRRQDLMKTLHELAQLFPDPLDKKRSGSSLLMGIGAVCLLVAQIGALPQLTIFSIWILVVGVVFYLFGPFLLRQTSIPLVFSLLAIPPPMSFALGLVHQFQITGAAMLGGALGLIGIKTRIAGPMVTLQQSGYTIVVGASESGVGVFLTTMTITLAYLIWQRVTFGKSIVVLIVAAFTSCVIGFLRITTLGLIAQANNTIAALFEGTLALVPALFTLLLSVGIIYGFSRKFLHRFDKSQEIPL